VGIGEAEILLKQMTLDEKVGQLNDSAGIVFPGFVIDQKLDELIIQSKGRSLCIRSFLPLC